MFVKQGALITFFSLFGAPKGGFGSNLAPFPSTFLGRALSVKKLTGGGGQVSLKAGACGPVDSRRDKDLDGRSSSASQRGEGDCDGVLRGGGSFESHPPFWADHTDSREVGRDPLDLDVGLEWSYFPLIIEGEEAVIRFLPCCDGAAATTSSGDAGQEETAIFW